MTAYSNMTGPGGRKSPSFGIGSLLFAVVLALIFYLLLLTMVRHGFFSGSRTRVMVIQTPIPT